MFERYAPPQITVAWPLLHQPIESGGGLWGCPSRKPKVCIAVIDGPITQFRAKATSHWKNERSTTGGIITQRRDRAK